MGSLGVAPLLEIWGIRFPLGADMCAPIRPMNPTVRNDLSHSFARDLVPLTDLGESRSIFEQRRHRLSTIAPFTCVEHWALAKIRPSQM